MLRRSPDSTNRSSAMCRTELHARSHGTHHAGRTQSRLLCRPQSTVPKHAVACGATTRRRSTGYPEFFLAHEMAHQWWGQAVGWRNYHEQWLSEGFAAVLRRALRAASARATATFGSVLRQMRKWAIDTSDQGPVYLGYRLGHIRNEGRIHRALVYNKGGAVLHMLRRFLGDDAFFRGIRRFYVESRYRKAGTDDLRVAMEAESGRSLERFFERWIYASTLPKVKFSYRTDERTGRRRSAASRRTGRRTVRRPDHLHDRLQRPPLRRSGDAGQRAHHRSAGPAGRHAARRRRQQERRHARRDRAAALKRSRRAPG